MNVSLNVDAGINILIASNFASAITQFFDFELDSNSAMESNTGSYKIHGLWDFYDFVKCILIVLR